MFTISVMTAPTRADLTPGHVDHLRDMFDGGNVIWLNPGVAAEFPVPTQPGNFWHHWGDMQKRGFDLAIQPTQGRVKSILIADMDSTMIMQECIDELADHAGVGDRVADIIRRAMNGELAFDEALSGRVTLLSGQPVGIIDEVLETRITLSPGSRELVATMRAQGAYAALVSGGFTDFTDAIACQLGFDEHRANTLLSQDGRLTGHVGMPILGRDAKVNALDDIASRLGTTPDSAIAVGDGANDLGMLQRAGTGVALHAKPVVAEQTRLRINHGDLTALLYLQGYRADEFVTP